MCVWRTGRRTRRRAGRRMGGRAGSRTFCFIPGMWGGGGGGWGWGGGGGARGGYWNRVAAPIIQFFPMACYRVLYCYA